MKNSKLVLSSVKFGLILLILLTNNSCTTLILLDKAESKSVSEIRHDVINQVTAAYLTPNHELVVCLRGLYEGEPPEQKYAFREFIQQVIENQIENPGYSTVPRSQVVLGCPYADNELEGWKPVKVEMISTDSQIASLHPFPGTNETIYEQEEIHNKNDKRVIYASNDLDLTHQKMAIELRTESVTKKKIKNGNPFLYLLIPVTVAVDIVTTPIIFVAAGTYLLFCNVTQQSNGSRCELIHPG